MAITLTPVLVLLDSLEQIVKQVITYKLDLFSKFSDLFYLVFLYRKSYFVFAPMLNVLLNYNLDIDDCAGNSCQNGGTCTDLLNDFMCSCAPGYTGPVCETAVNECDSVPCQYGGSCTDGDNTYTCACVTGVTGIDCEISTNSFLLL